MGRAETLRQAIKELKEKHEASNSELVNLLVTGRGDPSKGGSFERDVCRQLSLWWSSGRTDDLFWRTAGSGARATTRAKTGKKTAGHHGDITATTPEGKPLTDKFAIELKRGYNWHSAQDAIDRLPKSSVSSYEEFIIQARKSATEAGIPYWMLITRRDRRQALIFTPIQMIRSHTLIIDHQVVYWHVLDLFLSQVSPQDIKDL